jgi:hypothetical protein
MSGHPRFKKLLKQMEKIHLLKNHDYAKDEDPLSNLKMSEMFGVEPYIGTLVRMSDKFSRLCQIVKKGNAVKDETFEDSCLDLAVYSLLCIILHEEKNARYKKN